MLRRAFADSHQRLRWQEKSRQSANPLPSLYVPSLQYVGDFPCFQHRKFPNTSIKSRYPQMFPSLSILGQLVSLHAIIGN
jgi:hypothetical protein